MFMRGIVVCRAIICAVMLWSGLLAPTRAEEPKRLEMWTHWGEEPMKRRFIEETVREFEAANPNVTITLRWIPKMRLYQNLRQSLSQGIGPDIFYADPYPAVIKKWIDNGDVLNMRDRIDWRRFTPDSYQGLSQYGENAIYGVPLEMGEYAIYYNARIFAEIGIPIPASGMMTTDEFLHAARTFRAKGIIPVAVGNKDRGIASNMLFQGLLLRFAGVETLRGLKTGASSWTAPDIAAAFHYMNTLVDAGVFPENMNLLTYKEGYTLFVEGQAAMYVDGTWFFSKIADAQGQLSASLQARLGAMDFPLAPNGKGNAAIERMNGGGYLVRRQTRFPDDAAAFLNFMTSAENARKWTRYTQSPVSVNAPLAEAVSAPFLAKFFAARQDCREVLSPGIADLLSAKEYESWVRDVGILFLGGDLSVEETLQRLETAASK